MISNMITMPIQKAIDKLNDGTSELSTASSQVASASQHLAEGTSEQAAAIQETLLREVHKLLRILPLLSKAI